MTDIVTAETTKGRGSGSGRWWKRKSTTCGMKDGIFKKKFLPTERLYNGCRGGGLASSLHRMG